MKITSSTKLEAHDKETLDIKIEFDPGNAEEEGYASILYAVIDLVKKNITLASTLQELEESSQDVEQSAEEQ